MPNANKRSALTIFIRCLSRLRPNRPHAGGLLDLRGFRQAAFAGCARRGRLLASGVAQMQSHEVSSSIALIVQQQVDEAMGVAKTCGLRSAVALAAFVEEAKRSGFVADSLVRHGIQGAAVAPLV